MNSGLDWQRRLHKQLTVRDLNIFEVKYTHEQTHTQTYTHTQTKFFNEF